jgi:hypothetical protein
MRRFETAIATVAITVICLSLPTFYLVAHLIG